MGHATIRHRGEVGLGAALSKILGKIFGLRPSGAEEAKRQTEAQAQPAEPVQNYGRRATDVGVAPAPVVALPTLIERLTPDVERTIESLARRKFDPDPLAGGHFSRIVSLLSSAYKRHGFILEAAIREQLKTNPQFEVWNDPQFYISKDAMSQAATIKGEGPVAKQFKYDAKNPNYLQVDTVVWDRERRTIKAYEVKRGHGDHDAGKKRSIRRDLACVEAHLIDYARQRGFKAKEARAHVIFYYGKRSLPAPLSLVGEELDTHFGMSVYAEVETVNDHFRRRLFEILSA